MKHNINEAVEICTYLEPILAKVGYHCGLTGSCLYKGGSDKDIDVILYPHKPSVTLKYRDLRKVLLDAQIEFPYFLHDTRDYDRVVWRAKCDETRVDFFIFK